VRSYWGGRRLLCFALLTATLLAGCRIEESLIFHPDRIVSRNPSDIGMAFDDVFFRTQDGLWLHGWFIPHNEAKSTLLWFHGNAGNVSHRLLNIKLLHEHIKTHIFIFDYRGYGHSEGTPSEEGTYLDGTAAMHYLLERPEAGTRRIVLFGRSLGAAVAAEMALRFNTRGLILESPFVSVPEMARVIFPVLPLAALLRTRYDIVGKVRKIKTPLLVLHGERDEIVPFEHGKRVFEAAPQPKAFHIISGASHNDTFVLGGKEYFQTLANFIESVSEHRQ
jgi:uncharacterized protein